jgi:prepilin-type N-terminal cleavage/methylation domain-containing protein
LRRRAGYTLVELLVAMVVTGLVVVMGGRWIVHQTKSRFLSDRRIDVAEEMSMLREELFQDIHHGRILSFSRERLLVLRSRSGVSDTVVWTLRDGALLRGRDGSEAVRLGRLENLRVDWEPIPLPDRPGRGNLWWEMDSSQNGSIDGYELEGLLSIAVRIEGVYRTIPGMPQERESLTVRVPAAGL